MLNSTYTTYPQVTSRVCPDCRSKILLVNRTTVLEEGQFNPVTTSFYECSNTGCRDDFKQREVMRQKKDTERRNNKIIARSRAKANQ